jgi:hypothetical protein
VVSSYTYVRAWDYSDAAAPYPVAWHEINITKSNGQYNRYIMLGSLVDHEDGFIQGPNGLADDLNGLDDEDGVVMPPLSLGSTVQIPVSVTAYDNSYGFLNAWIDWNGDGDFNDPGEKLTPTPILVTASGLYHINTTVPNDAVTTTPVIARFRIGANMGPAGVNPWGEVEDYEVQIIIPQVIYAASIHQVSGPFPVTGAGQQIDYEVTLVNPGSLPVTNINAAPVFQGSGSGTLSMPAESLISDNILQPGETWSYTAAYIVTQNDLNTLTDLESSIAFTSAEIQGSIVATAITPIQRMPELMVNITASPGAGLMVGDIVTLNHSVFNNGNVTLGNVGLMTSNNGAGLMGAVLPAFVSTMDPGASAQFISSYEVTAADVIAQLPVQFQTLAHGLFNGLGYTAPDNAVITMKPNVHEVDLSALEATLIMDFVELNWATRFEINNANFEIMRRHEQEQHFVYVGSVSGAGSSISPNQYFYLDNVTGLPAGRVFYKLQVSEQTASVLIQKNTGMAESSNPQQLGLSIYPLPPSDVIYVTIFGLEQTEAEVRLLNAAGQLLNIRKEKINNQFQIDVSKLPAGMYLINVITGDDVVIEKFVKP